MIVILISHVIRQEHPWSDPPRNQHFYVCNSMKTKCCLPCPILRSYNSESQLTSNPGKWSAMDGIYPRNILSDVHPAFTVSLVGVYCIVKEEIWCRLFSLFVANLCREQTSPAVRGPALPPPLHTTFPPPLGWGRHQG
jgi:hypothetical protein